MAGPTLRSGPGWVSGLERLETMGTASTAASRAHGTSSTNIHRQPQVASTPSAAHGPISDGIVQPLPMMAKSRALFSGGKPRPAAT